MKSNPETLQKFIVIKLKIRILQALIDKLRWNFPEKVQKRKAVTCMLKRTVRRKNELVYSYLSQKYSCIIAKYQKSNTKVLSNERSNYTIWMLWLTGENTVPPVVKKCIESIRKNKGIYKLIVLDEKSLYKYIELPNIISEKYQRGIISSAHFSDFVRIELLIKFGGVWLDSTVLCTSEIPKDIAKLPQYHPKGLNSFPYDYMWVDCLNWGSYLLGGKAGGDFYSYLRECLLMYWSQEDRAIDYLFLNFFAKIGREQIEVFKDEYEGVPVNNANCEVLYHEAEEIADSEWKKIFSEDKTIFYKLNRRHEKAEMVDGKQTKYGYVLSLIDKSMEKIGEL